MKAANTQPRITRRSPVLLGWLFPLVLVAPLMLALTKRNEGFPLPRSAGEFLLVPAEFKYYLATDFAPRDRLSSWRNGIQQWLNGTNQLSGNVVVGHDGYLFSYFLQGDNDADANYAESIPPLTLPHAQLQEFVAKIDQRHRVCESIGAVYIPVIVALKPLVHAAFLPAHRNPVFPKPLSHSPFYSFLHSRAPEVQAVDTLASLRLAGEHHPVYYRTDSHWTDYGALVAASELITRLRQHFPALPRIRFDEMAVKREQTLGGNEARVLGIQNQVIDWHAKVVSPINRPVQRTGSTNIAINELKLGGFQTYFSCPAGEIDSLLVFHNSFGVAFMPHIAPYFRHSHFSWNAFSEELVRQSRPTIVVDLLLTY